jgi:hypothetical protein
LKKKEMEDIRKGGKGGASENKKVNKIFIFLN